MWTRLSTEATSYDLSFYILIWCHTYVKWNVCNLVVGTSPIKT
jgi:hypothetical protein